MIDDDSDDVYEEDDTNILEAQEERENSFALLYLPDKSEIHQE